MGTLVSKVMLSCHGEHAADKISRPVFNEDSGFSILDELGQNSLAGCNYRFAASKSLSDRPAGPVTARDQKDLKIKKV